MTADDDARLDRWRWLRTDDATPVLEALRTADVRDAATITRLRTRCDAERLRVAIELTEARRRAVGRLDNADMLIADIQGVQQATSSPVARHKAARCDARLDTSDEIVDLCCGIGGDTMALAAVRPTRGIDRDPVRAWMTSVNAGVETDVADVTTLETPPPVFHLDPARRDETTGKRRHDYADLVPGPAVIELLLNHARAASVKLGPGVSLDALPSPERSEVEIINHRGTLVQAVLWWGDLAAAPGHRTATWIDTDGAATSWSADAFNAPAAPIAAVGSVLLEIDPAIERAGLIDALSQAVDLPLIHPRLGAMTADAVVDSPWLRPFAVRDVLPWRPRRVTEWLRGHDGGEVTIRTRGGAVDPDHWQTRLRGDGSTSYVVFILRFDREVRAIITERIDASFDA